MREKIFLKEDLTENGLFTFPASAKVATERNNDKSSRNNAFNQMKLSSTFCIDLALEKYAKFRVDD